MFLTAVPDFANTYLNTPIKIPILANDTVPDVATQPVYLFSASDATGEAMRGMPGCVDMPLKGASPKKHATKPQRSSNFLNPAMKTSYSSYLNPAYCAN